MKVIVFSKHTEATRTFKVSIYARDGGYLSILFNESYR